MPEDLSPKPDHSSLHPATQQRVRAVRAGLSLDGWAVVVAVVLAALVRFGLTVRW